MLRLLLLAAAAVEDEVVACRKETTALELQLLQPLHPCTPRAPVSSSTRILATVCTKGGPSSLDGLLLMTS